MIGEVGYEEEFEKENDDAEDKHGGHDKEAPKKYVTEDVSSLYADDQSWTVLWESIPKDTRVQVVRSHAEYSLVSYRRATGWIKSDLLNDSLPTKTMRIAAGDGEIILDMLQPAGGRAMPARDFLNGTPVRQGSLIIAAPEGGE